ncbi:hypothetical protein B9479_002883 [Cryptococcus floricola]|uniref:Uncharacterized protein n=1 Tax=Cryptococcus floricola TaxID=2591691 RepID=A0A5D3B2I6_9TREE|nr:hypothetical protein B9479_002883 [Cryptococcus floricola]
MSEEPKPVPSVIIDEDGHPVDSADAVGRPFLGLNEEGKIIIGPFPPVVDIPVPLRPDNGAPRVRQDIPYTPRNKPHHLEAGPTPSEQESDNHTSRQVGVTFRDLHTIIMSMQRHEAELQRAQVDPLELPTLTTLCTSNLGVVHHLHNLQKYFTEYASRFQDSTHTTPQWQVSQANKSITKRREFKNEALSPNWELETRRVFEGLQCQGTTLAAWTAFEEKAGECQMVLGDGTRAISDSNMRHKLLYGLPPHIITRVEDRMEDRGLHENTITLPVLRSVIDRVFQTEAPVSSFALYPSINCQSWPEVAYKVEDLVYLNTRDFRHEYKTSSARNSAKLVPRWEGPYTITVAFPHQSLYDLNFVLTRSTSTTRRHASLLKPFCTSAKFHGEVSPTILSSNPPPPPRVLQVIEERVLKPHQRHPGVRQVRVRIERERVGGRWMSRDEAKKHEGWEAAWEEYLCDDALYLDMLEVVEL